MSATSWQGILSTYLVPSIETVTVYTESESV